MRTRFLVAFAALVMLAGCVSPQLFARNYYALSAADAGRLTGGEVGGVLIDLKLGEPCSTIALRYANLETGAVTIRQLERTYSDGQISSFDAGSKPAALLLAPGRYAFRGGVCRYALGSSAAGGVTVYTVPLNAMALWLAPIEVKPGEIVYPGTAEPEKISFEWGVALTDWEKLMGRKARSADSYNLYLVADRFEAARTEFASFNPALAERVVNRTTPALLDKEAVRTLISDAYAAATSGVPADQATADAQAKAARARVSTDLRGYLRKQLEAAGIVAPVPGADDLPPTLNET